MNIEQAQEIEKIIHEMNTCRSRLETIQELLECNQITLGGQTFKTYSDGFSNAPIHLILPIPEDRKDVFLEFLNTFYAHEMVRLNELESKLAQL